MNLKHDLLRQPLELKKTHDFVAVKEPRLAVVFIHGIASDSSTFTNALKYLEGTRSLRDIRFVTFDLLGSGKSYKSDSLNYDYKDQLEALHNSILKLKLKTPLVLVGHSLGTLIVTRYANTYKKSVKQLILLSPPVYTEEDLESTAFRAGMELFRNAVALRSRKYLKEKSFDAMMNKIVANKKNYKNLVELKTPAVLIYGDADKFIAPRNIRKVVKENPKYLQAIKTIGRHSVSRDKYGKMVGILEKVLNETI